MGRVNRCTSIKLLRKLTAEMGQPKAAEYFLNSLHVSSRGKQR